ncbi:MAG TPA: phytoene/squalene synthase family protein [Chitinophagales bacterium]|jgi:phytoene synthase|nr:phytoene/squalene synthase family protein [Chitinophagales bacterium]HPH86929.1 phytoene/squalene synthase family protein [Chitinophagales bacterium]HPN18485.1 phytoene/squalene synthase family protein [Chitinophagales bacterium]
MNSFQLYQNSCVECSELITKRYSTSFSLGIRVFDKEFRNPIYSIYGFVRFADEIVDTFHQYDKKELLDDFRKETFKAIVQKISLNPILQAFQQVVNEYEIDHQLITDFLDSMEMDLHKSTYESEAIYNKYIYGSAEVVGLMCLQVFTKGDNAFYSQLAPYAKSLGAAFQKINFLRDMNSDLEEHGRVYFPGIDLTKFDEFTKQEILKDIQLDFDNALEGIRLLPKGARRGVYLAYVYYLNLYKNIRKASVEKIMEERIRVSDKRKAYLLMNTVVRNSMNLL